MEKFETIAALMVLDKFMSLSLLILLELHDYTLMSVIGLRTQF